jgi:hypothetical protein
MPGATLNQIWEAFDRQNYQKRTKLAVKAKIKDLGLSVERGKQICPLVSSMLSQKGYDEVAVSTPSEEQLSILSQQSFKVDFLP